MPTWGEILQEINDTPSPHGGLDWDRVRRKYLTQLHALTGRNTVIYYTDWMSGMGGNAVSIVLSGIARTMFGRRQAREETCYELAGRIHVR